MFFQKTVDGVMATVTKTIADLESVAAAQITKADAKSAKAAQLVSECNGHQTEAMRASKYAANLRKLVG